MSTITTITYTTDRDKFANTDADIMATIDEAASLHVLEDMTVTAIQAAYPDAEVTFSWANVSPCTLISAYNYGDEDDDQDAEFAAQDHISEIAGRAWEQWFDHLVYRTVTA